MVDKKTRPTAWKKGQSGNPKGKPRGSGAVQKLRDSIGQHIPSILDNLVMQAQGGDIQAARLLLERVMPPIKATEQASPIELPENGTLTEKGQAVLAAVAQGIIAPMQGAQLISAIGNLAKVIEIDDLEERIKQLEATREGEL